MHGFTIFLCWIICFWWQIAPTLSTYFTGQEPDNMGASDKEKIIELAKELLLDAKVQERQIKGVRENHKPQQSYEIGLVIGKIRERYKRMTLVYREMFDRKTGRAHMSPPAIEIYYPFHYIVAMQIVHALEVDIDKLVHTLEMIPLSSLGAPSQSMMMAAMIPTPAGMSSSPPLPNRLRARDDANETTTLRFKSEDELKQHYREKFNSRNGRNNNWTLDEYYGFI